MLVQSFIRYKGSTLETSLSLGLGSKKFGDLEGFNLECKAAGIWLLSEAEWLEQMMNSRESNRDMYFSRFPPSIESLSEYLLKGPLGNKDQILFLVIDQNGNLQGHIGLKLVTDGNAEIDNVLRISRNHPGVMKFALNEIMRWGNSDLGIAEFVLKVISTNTRAINLYEELGFSLKERFRLRIESHPSGLMALTPTSQEESNTEEEMFIMGKSFEQDREIHK